MPALARSRLAVLALVAVLAVAVAGCGGTGTPTPASSAADSAPPGTATPQATPALGEVVPAPGSTSSVYRPNPAAIVVAIDPGHGGCLDWGVPNPWDNTVTKAEKADTLAIGLALRDLLEAQGITVVMTRTDDSALAGDNYPALGCNGPDWRDVDGNGEAGFEETGRTRTRDELQARIDLANLARADMLLGIHINSITQDGVVYQIAATETYYDDETPWGVTGSGALGRDVQAGVVAALADATDYDRQDRGTEAVAYYLISRQWAASDTCETSGDTWCKPHRGAQMPAVLSEVGSMSLPAESELLATAGGRDAVARGILDGLGTWFGERQLAVRYDALVAGGSPGVAPVAVPGSGPPFWLPELDAATAASGVLPLRLTNTGQAGWPSDLQLAVGWSASDEPYLAAAPTSLEPVDLRIPALAPGESVTVEVPLQLPATSDRSITWITLSGTPGDFADLGSPALQLGWTP
jgi:N-acetylmuramoyl-L-alanine amidase